MNLNFSIIELGKNRICSGSKRFRTDKRSWLLPFYTLFERFVFAPSASRNTDLLWYVDFDDSIRLVFIKDTDLFKLFSFSTVGLKFNLKTFVFFLSLSLEGTFTLFSSFEINKVLETDFDSSLSFIVFDKSLKIWLWLKYSSFHSLKKLSISLNLALFSLFGSIHFLMRF